MEEKYNYIDMREDTPTLDSKKCKIISFFIRIFLQFTTFLNSLIALYLYDYFIALLVLVLSFIVMGIIRSKIINSVIPPSQSEYQFSDKEIADWYTVKEMCIKI